MDRTKARSWRSLEEVWLSSRRRRISKACSMFDFSDEIFCYERIGVRCEKMNPKKKKEKKLKKKKKKKN